jgi:hypothetical protein
MSCFLVSGIYHVIAAKKDTPPAAQNIRS